MEKTKSRTKIRLRVENPCKNKEYVGRYLGVCENTETASLVEVSQRELPTEQAILSAAMKISSK